MRQEAFAIEGVDRRAEARRIELDHQNLESLVVGLDRLLLLMLLLLIGRERVVEEIQGRLPEVHDDRQGQAKELQQIGRRLEGDFYGGGTRWQWAMLGPKIEGVDRGCGALDSIARLLARGLEHRYRDRDIGRHHVGAGIHCESLLQHTSEIGEKLPSERSQQGRHEATLACHVFVEETRVLVVDDAQDGDVMLERAKPNLGLGATRERQLVHQIKELAESRRRWVSGRGAKASTVEREREGQYLTLAAWSSSGSGKGGCSMAADARYKTHTHEHGSCSLDAARARRCSRASKRVGSAIESRSHSVSNTDACASEPAIETARASDREREREQVVVVVG